MSGGVSSYQGKSGGNLELKIIVRYEGLKATQYFSKYTSASDAVLREDLLALKLPHAKRENTTFISYGCVACVWPVVPKNGILHKQIITKIKPNNPHEQKALGILLANLSISNIVAKEIYPDVGKGRKNLKRPNPFTNSEVSEGSSTILPRSVDNGYRVRVSTKPPPITETRHDSTVPKDAEAEAFLQDVRESFRPHKIPKTEPVDVPLPPDPPPPTRTLPRSTSSHSSHVSSASKATNPPESASSSSPFRSQQPPQAVGHVPPSHINHVSVLPPKHPPPRTPRSDLGKTIMSTSLPDRPSYVSPLPSWSSPATTPTSDSGKTIMPTSLPDRPAPIKEMLRELQPLLSAAPQSLPEPTQRQFPVQVPEVKTTNTTPIPSSQRPLEVTAVTNSRPKVSDVPKIQRLTRESCDIRRQITADTVRDADIISELKQLNAAYIPHPLRVGNVDTVLARRIKKLEQDLDNERRMRLETEDVIKDIRRECKAPFVVPGLLDAFIKLSRLTTQATRSNGTVLKDNG